MNLHTQRGSLLYLLADAANPVTPQELCVSLWRLNPQQWGLKGFERLYPDFRKVAARLAELKRHKYVVTVDGVYWRSRKGTRALAAQKPTRAAVTFARVGNDSD